MRALLLMAFALMLPPALLQAVQYGATRAEVIREFGQPVSALQRGAREVLTFRDNVRIELEAGRVTSIRGLTPNENGQLVVAVPPPAEATAPPAAPTPAPAGESAPASTKKAEAPDAGTRAAAELEKQMAEENAKARAEMEKAIGRMEAQHDSVREPAPAPSFNPLRLLLELGLKWILMLAALFLTCKYWEANVEWPGLMLAAAADTGVRAMMSFAGGLMGMYSLFYADEAVAAIALVFVLRRVSSNKSLQQAVTITMTCKVFSVVVNALLITVALNALF